MLFNFITRYVISIFKNSNAHTNVAAASIADSKQNIVVCALFSAKLSVKLSKRSFERRNAFSSRKRFEFKNARA